MKSKLLIITILLLSLGACKKRTGLKTPAAQNSNFELTRAGIIASHEGIRCKVTGAGDMFKENEFMFMRLGVDGRYVLLKINSSDEFIKPEETDGQKEVKPIFFEAHKDNKSDQRAQVFATEPQVVGTTSTRSIFEVRVDTDQFTGAIHNITVLQEQEKEPIVTDSIMENIKVNDCQNHNFKQTVVEI